MKKLLFLLSFFALSVASVIAKPIDNLVAGQVAQNFWSQVSKTPFELTDISEDLGYEHLYIFANLDGVGFIILPADDCATPVLAYSTENRFSLDNIPIHVSSWLQNYDDEIAQLEAVGAKADKGVSDEWNVLLNNTSLYDGTKASVNPLLSTTWNQEPFYNDLCPLYDGEHRSVTGCTATATAQVMKYWNHPLRGLGSHTYVDTLSDINTFDTLSADFGATTYDWEHMPNSLSSSSSDTEVLAVATLMLHVGIAVEMDYGSSSGAYSNSYGFFDWAASENALKYYFKYNSALRGVEKNHVSDDEWKDLLKEDLNAGRPIIYSGEEWLGGGHAFVCDGYNFLGKFHFNWGWGGIYDGYFHIGTLNPSYSFNKNNMALLGVYPDTVETSDAIIVEALSSDTTMGIVTGGGCFTPYHDTVTLTAQAKEGYRFLRWSDYNIYTPRIFMPNSDIQLTAEYVPIEKDTASYSFDLFFSRVSKFKHYDYFGIRLPAAAMASCRNLSSVQIHDGLSGRYNLYVYEGGTDAPQTLMHTQTFRTRETMKWMTIALDSAVTVDASKPLWIAVEALDSNSWAPLSYFSGNYDGAWYRNNGGDWQHEWGNHPFSWMLRALFSPRDPFSFNVEAFSDSLGTVSGGGLFTEGDTATLTATAIEGYRFDHWSNGSTANPLSFEVRCDTSLTAYFVENTAINTVTEAKVAIHPNPFNDRLNIEGVKVLHVDVVDLVGRLVAQFNGTNSLLVGSLPPSIYTIRITTPEGTVMKKVVKR